MNISSVGQQMAKVHEAFGGVQVSREMEVEMAKKIARVEIMFNGLGEKIDIKA